MSAPTISEIDITEAPRPQLQFTPVTPSVIVTPSAQTQPTPSTTPSQHILTDTRRGKAIKVLLCLCFPIHLAAFTTAMLTFGMYSLLMTVFATVFTFAMTVVLLTLTDKERARNWPRVLPAACGFPAIISWLLLTIIWLISTAWLLTTITMYYRRRQEEYGYRYDRSFMPVLAGVEMAFAFLQAAVLIALMVLALLERKSILAQRRQSEKEKPSLEGETLNSSTTSPNLRDTPRGRILRILICVAIFLELAAFSIGMANFGALSLWLTTAAFGASLYLTLNLLALTLREQSRPWPKMLPAACRFPGIVLCFFLTILWLVAAVMLIIFVASPSSDWHLEFLVAPFVCSGIEAALAIIEAGVFLTMGVLGILERKRILKESESTSAVASPPPTAVSAQPASSDS